MKIVITIIIALLTGVVSMGQDTLVIYYDLSWNKTSSEDFSYYRKAFKEDKKKWIATDYYKDGTVQMKGQYIRRRMKKKNGQFIYFYKNGEKKSESHYVNNIQTGLYQKWFDNGDIKLLGNYSENNKVGTWISYFKNSQIRKKGSYQDGKMIDEWNWFFENGQICAKEMYENDEVVSANYWNIDGEVADSSQANRKPEFPGGLDKLMLFLSENTKYPEVARHNAVQGRVFVEFVVDKDGIVINEKVVKGVYPELDAEALRVVKLMPNWTPAKQHNRLVKVSYIVPIRFKLYY